MMVTSRVLGLELIRYALFGDLLEQVLEAAARAVDFLGKLPLVALQRRQLLAQTPIFVAQSLTQLRGLADLFFEDGQLRVHRHTIVWKILLSQGVRNRFQCRFQPVAYRGCGHLCSTINALVRGVPARASRRCETGKRCGTQSIKRAMPPLKIPRVGERSFRSPKPL